MSGWILFASSFLATGVEMVEALTIILATGLTRGWKSAFIGTACAAVILLVAIAAFGVTLTQYVDIAVLRLIVGAFLMIFGLQWLRKAILRYSGFKGYHDEAAVFDREVRTLRTEGAPASGIDWTGFVVSFKGVLLEGLEAAFIVITFGYAAETERPPATLLGMHGIGLAAFAGACALVVVVLAGVLVHRPLSTVPENTLKFAVGLMLTSFGTFWAGEGIGVSWPLEDATILVLLAFYGLTSWLAIRWLQQSHASAHPAHEGARV